MEQALQPVLPAGGGEPVGYAVAAPRLSFPFADSHSNVYHLAYEPLAYEAWQEALLLRIAFDGPAMFPGICPG